MILSFNRIFIFQIENQSIIGFYFGDIIEIGKVIKKGKILPDKLLEWLVKYHNNDQTNTSILIFVSKKA